MLDYQSTDDCRMVFLRAQLDEPELTEGALCGRCDNCAGDRYSADVDTTAVDSARDQLQRPGVELAPRKQWPSGMKKLGVDVSGRIDDGPSVGRTIGRLTDLGWAPGCRRCWQNPTGPHPTTCCVPRWRCSPAGNGRPARSQ